jgi:hypothetical protein
MITALIGAHITWAADPATAPTVTYADDLNFLRKHVKVAELTDETGGARLVVVPAWQGRVMTSTGGGLKGPSLGWVNRSFIETGKLAPRFNAYGGEDRFWLGPEAGPYALFFAAGEPTDLEHWITPAPLDREPFEIVEYDETKKGNILKLRKRMQVTNYAGTKFDLEVERSIEIPREIPSVTIVRRAKELGVEAIVYQTRNTVKNIGKEPWRPDTGLISIWILGMYPASPGTAVAIPYKQGAESDLGPVVTTDYFGEIPPDRLVVTENAIVFRADGRYRSKIGVAPQRLSRPSFGSYDADRGVVTVVQYPKPIFRTDFVDSRWDQKGDPYRGDVINVYNDGPATPGAGQLGAFYELESSSPALALEPGESATHIHRTFHFHGKREGLNAAAREFLQATLDEITAALSSGSE